MIFILLQSFTEKKNVLHASWSKFEIAVIPLVLLRYLPSVYVALQLFFFFFFFSLCLFVFRFFCDLYNTMKQYQREKCFKYISHYRKKKKNLSQLPIGNRCGSMNPGLSQTFYFDSAQFEIENTKHICFVLIEAEYKRYSKNRKENLKEAN